MASWSSSHGSSGVEWYPGQKNALSGVFGDGGIFDQFLKGRPNAGFERQQTQGLEQLKARMAQNGTLQSPLGTRAVSDYLQKSNASAGDSFMQTLFSFLQPAGQTSKSHSSGGGVL